jgi:hypothetical protein
MADDLFPPGTSGAGDIAIYPADEAFRPMTGNELARLTADIAANGLREPIKLGRINGHPVRLINGRNRLAGCRAAKVEPRCKTIDFADEDSSSPAFESANERRDCQKASAIGLALLYPGAQGQA